MATILKTPEPNTTRFSPPTKKVKVCAPVTHETDPIRLSEIIEGLDRAIFILEKTKTKQIYRDYANGEGKFCANGVLMNAVFGWNPRKRVKDAHRNMLIDYDVTFDLSLYGVKKLIGAHYVSLIDHLNDNASLTFKEIAAILKIHKQQLFQRLTNIHTPTATPTSIPVMNCSDKETKELSIIAH